MVLIKAAIGRSSEMESELREGYKMTELGALPEGWEVVELKSYIKILTGYPFDSSKFNDKSGFPLIRIRDLNKKNPETFYDGDYDAGFIVKQGDVLVGMDGDFNVVRWNNYNGLLNQRICKIDSVPKKADQYYIYYTLIGNIKKINDTTPQTTVKHLSTKDINNLIIPLPSLPEQRRIATILSTLDETVEHTEALIEKYKNIKAGLMSDLLMRGIDEEGRIRSEGTHRFKDSALGRVPEEWEITFMGKCCKKITDGSHFSPLPIKDGPKIANVKDIFGKSINIKSCTSISHEDFIKLEKGGCSPNRGDVLLSKDGTIGKTLVYEQDEKIVLLSSIAIIKPEDNLDSYFLHNILKSFYFDKQMLILISGSALRRIVLRDINLIQIPLPPLPEQHRIAEILTAADQRIGKEEAYRDKLLQLKKGLMQDLLTGKVRVKNGSAQIVEQSEN